MTLSLGNKLRKVQDDGVTPVPNEVHVLYEVSGIGSLQEKNETGEYVSTPIARLKVIE